MLLLFHNQKQLHKINVSVTKKKKKKRKGKKKNNEVPIKIAVIVKEYVDFLQYILKYSLALLFVMKMTTNVGKIRNLIFEFT